MNEKGIHILNVSKEYLSNQSSETTTAALKDLTLSIQSGEFVGIVGMNGSGKTTLARLLNGLILPSRGMVMVNGVDTRDKRKIKEVRRQVAMVFQNPDNQIVSSIVEEEIAFGPENLKLSHEEVSQRVEEVMQLMGLTELRQHAPHLLSGGQKQRVAIASALAMQPDYLVLDEPTSMLDQSCRKELIDYLHELNKKQGITIILISHCMEDLVQADRLVVLQKGGLVADRPPWKVFQQQRSFVGLKAPDIVRLAQRLKSLGYKLNEKLTTREEMVEQLCRLSKSVM